MKIYINKIKESWIVDRLKNEWIQYNKVEYSKSILSADIIWIIAPWTWNSKLYRFFRQKKIICTIHHFEDDKNSESYLSKILENDKYISAYHVLNEKSYNQLKNLTNKPIYTIPFWINQNLFYEIKDKSTLRYHLKLPESKFLVGSFQRDTEGSDLTSPKMIKGPDRLIEIICKLKNENNNLCVVLTGKRRQYVISKFEELDINYIYFENVSFEKLNKLYNSLNLYIVSSRIEGGPFSILECGISKTPIISTNVGIASKILAPESIFNMENFQNAVPNVEIAFENAKKFTIPIGMKKFSEMFLDLIS